MAFQGPGVAGQEQTQQRWEAEAASIIGGWSEGRRLPPHSLFCGEIDWRMSLSTVWMEG